MLVGDGCVQVGGFFAKIASEWMVVQEVEEMHEADADVLKEAKCPWSQEGPVQEQYRVCVSSMWRNGVKACTAYST